MPDYKSGKWVSEIIALQQDDGHWGYFHTLSNPMPKQPITTEKAYFDYVLGHETGIYYIYDSPLSCTPNEFKSRDASRYLAAIEILSEYPNEYCKKRLKFVADWLNDNRDADGCWDMGSTVRDGVYFPLSDSWRSNFARKLDCTNRIEKVLLSLHAA